jgi:hypothetical protein
MMMMMHHLISPEGGWTRCNSHSSTHQAHATWQVSAPVRACVLSEDCRHLLAVLGNGYIFRFEYHKPSPADDESARAADAAESDGHENDVENDALDRKEDPCH